MLQNDTQYVHPFINKNLFCFFLLKRYHPSYKFPLFTPLSIAGLF